MSPLTGLFLPKQTCQRCAPFFDNSNFSGPSFKNSGPYLQHGIQAETGGKGRKKFIPQTGTNLGPWLTGGKLRPLLFLVSRFFLTLFQTKFLQPEINFSSGIKLDMVFALPFSSLRHWQPCTPFRLHSTYTRPPYPGATPSSSLPLHHLRALSLLVPTSSRTPHHLTPPTTPPFVNASLVPACTF